MKEKDKRNNKFHYIIKTKGIDSKLSSDEIEKKYTLLILQDIDDYSLFCRSFF